MAKQPKDSMKLQLKELATNKTFIAMFPNLNTLANISLSIPVSTASVERKTRLRNRLSDKSLSHLMNIAIESPNQLKETDLKEIVNLWNIQLLDSSLVCIAIYLFVIYVFSI